ncbi:class I SAM-dependent methyltransferase [Trebonia kvetii]|uniref:Class I SAM-dependent methyltransferase n=1 Tax=Trebonia kvetii TaxID=2480626 RepID=A0A6P2C0B4_9ACTN|nr:class I SAM-dependent methyltransferase [Trebonia kvetii]TVZ04580.1 class I SAM-dependent methyltransferase [Trebonia kvetii]
MNTETAPATGPTADPAAVGQVMGQLMADLAATSGMLLTVIGVRTGLWDSLAAEPATPSELAARASAAEPYVREWLRSQAAAGYVRYEPATGRYSLPAAVAALMTGEPLRGLVEGAGLQAAAQWAEVARYEEAFRTGRGIGWDEHGPAHSHGMDLISRAVVVPALAGWLAALDGVAPTLEAGGTVADVGCGYGSPTIAMARAFPRSRFLGIDADDASVARARKAAAAAGLGTRVTFEVADAAGLPSEGGEGFDLVTFVDCLHDLGDPVAALRGARKALAPGGSVLLVEHAGSQHTEENLNPAGRFFYAASALVCTPNALAHGGAGLGTIPGEQALRAVAAESGFSQVSRVGVDAPLNILLQLRPLPSGARRWTMGRWIRPGGSSAGTRCLRCCAPRSTRRPPGGASCC